jgi:hypothetical protein
MEVITYSEWLEQADRQTAQQIALLAAQAGVDGIVDVANDAAFPAVGIEGYLYLAKDTGKLYSWNATTEGYVRVDAGSDYSLPVATDTVLGGVKIGSGLTITEGVLSTDAVSELQKVTIYTEPGDIAVEDEVVVANVSSFPSFTLDITQQGEAPTYQVMKSGVFAGTASGDVTVTIGTVSSGDINLTILDGETFAEGLTATDLEGTILNTDYTITVPTEGEDTGKIVLVSKAIGGTPVVPTTITITGNGITIDGGATGSFVITTTEDAGLPEIVELIVPDTTAPGTITLNLDGNIQTIEATTPLTQSELITEIMALAVSYPAWTFESIAGGVRFTTTGVGDITTESFSLGDTISSYMLNLPVADTVGKAFKIKNVGALSLIVVPNGTDTIDGDNSSVELAIYGTLTLLCYEVGKWCEL